jgi:hypothetical protein
VDIRPDIDFTTLIPELKSWNNGHGISVEAWVGCSGTFELAVGYSRLFWPDFIQHDDCVFLANGFTVDNYRAWLEQCHGDRERVETVMNHRHVFDYFSHAGGIASEAQIVYLGRVLRDMWTVKLRQEFPDRTFVVSFPEGPFEDLVDYEVTFWQSAAESGPSTT